MAEESALKPFYSVLILALVCSALVAGAAVGLRPLQEVNRQLDQKKNILRAAGMFQPGDSVEKQFEAIETRIVDLATGTFVSESVLDSKNYNQAKAALSKDLGHAIDKDDDLARLSRMEKYSLVYLVKSASGIEQVILPVRGKGLWSTMYAYVALDADLTSIRGISFYAHGETPGLGGEIENAHWLAGWQGKKMYDEEGQVALRVVKGEAPDEGAGAGHLVDGLSGATITASGVSDLMNFWFGDHGFKPFLVRLKKNGGLNG